jgi:hypothetical protein
MEENKEGSADYSNIVTKGGYKALLVNNQIIRKSSSPRRITEDEETYEEYKVRLKLLKQIEKDKKPELKFMSRFNIKGQNYTATYVKKKVEEDTKNLDKGIMEEIEKSTSEEYSSLEEMDLKQIIK